MDIFISTRVLGISGKCKKKNVFKAKYNRSYFWFNFHLKLTVSNHYPKWTSGFKQKKNKINGFIMELNDISWTWAYKPRTSEF